MKTEANLKKDILEEAGKCSKMWNEVKSLAATESDGDTSQIRYFPNGTKGYNVATFIL